MPGRWFAVGCVVLVSVAAGPAARAQQAVLPAAEPPAHLAVVDGPATLERAERLMPAAANMPLVPGDRLRTRDGRLEILFADGSTLDVDRHTTVDLLDASLIRLLNGRVLLTAAASPSGFDAATGAVYRIDAPGGIAQVGGPGVYEIDAADTRTVDVGLAVVQGSATLSTEQASVVLHAGERSVARNNGVPDAPRVVNVAQTDALVRWADAQQQARVGARSAVSLPPGLEAYAGTFDQYGSWQSLAPYGDVWYPRVETGWRPYSDGHWGYVAPYGWTWIGNEPFAWAAFHYGRWGRASGAWFWIPGSQWSPAWVSWAVAPGYVGWCALGHDNAPAVGLYHPRHQASPWRGWVVVPRKDFDDRPVARHALREEALRAVPRTFIQQRVAPAIAGLPRVVVPTAAVPLPRYQVAIPQSLATSPVRVVMPRTDTPAFPSYRNWTPGVSTAPLPGIRGSDGRLMGAVDSATALPRMRAILPPASPAGAPVRPLLGSPWSSYRTMSSARDSAAERQGRHWTAPSVVLPGRTAPGAATREVAPRPNAPAGTANGMAPVMPRAGGTVSAAPGHPPRAGGAQATPHGVVSKHPAVRPQGHPRVPRRP